MKGDITKLPKWAQAEIERLTRDLESAYAKLNVGPEDSDTFADPYSEARQPLGKGTSIVFEFGEGHGKRINARLEGETLVVQGGDSLIVQPRASNSIYLRTERWS